MKPTQPSYREAERRIMVAATPRINGEAECHFCREVPGTQQHELINRGQTSSNPQALRESFSHYVTSWLCAECHSIAPRQDVEAALWLYNFRLWGEAEVALQYNIIVILLGFRPQVHFPEA